MEFLKWVRSFRCKHDELTEEHYEYDILPISMMGNSGRVEGVRFVCLRCGESKGSVVEKVHWD